MVNGSRYQYLTLMYRRVCFLSVFNCIVGKGSKNKICPMTSIKILLIIFVIALSPYVAFSEDGQTLFKGNCAACHTIGKGKLVGPDLKDADKRHPEAWLMKWIKSSQSLIKSGDADAIKLFNDNNKIPMTDFSLFSEEQIKSIVGYIQSESAPPVVAAPSVSANTSPAPSQQTNKSIGKLALTHYILLGTIVILLIVIWQLARVIKQLTNEIAKSNGIS